MFSGSRNALARIVRLGIEPRPQRVQLGVVRPKADAHAGIERERRANLPAVLSEQIDVPHPESHVLGTGSLSHLERPPDQQISKLAARAPGSERGEHQRAVLVVVEVLLFLQARDAATERQRVRASLLRELVGEQQLVIVRVDVCIGRCEFPQLTASPERVHERHVGALIGKEPDEVGTERVLANPGRIPVRVV